MLCNIWSLQETFVLPERSESGVWENESWGSFFFIGLLFWQEKMFMWKRTLNKNGLFNPKTLPDKNILSRYKTKQFNGSETKGEKNK